MIPPLPRSTLFPYTTLFRSPRLVLREVGRGDALVGDDAVVVEVLVDPLDGLALVDRQGPQRSEEHTSELQSLRHLVCRLLLEKKKTSTNHDMIQGTNDRYKC